MSKKIIATLFLATAVTAFAFAHSANAAEEDVGFPYWPSAAVPLLPCTGTDCVDLCQILILIQRIIYFMMTLGILILAPVLFIWGGFLILVSGGSPERLGKGKSVLWGTVVGVIITLGAFIIVNSFLWLVGNNKTGVRASWPNVQCTVAPPPP
jgi:hypothetical protein